MKLQLASIFLVALAGCGSGSGGEVCSAPATCPSAASRSYRACTSADHSSCSLRASDGTTFSCASCADCSAASLKAANWCGGSVGTDGGGNTTDGGTSGTSPDATCATLLDCLANNVPAVFAGALQTYGPGGACWQNASTTAACHNACQGSLTQYQQSGQCCLGDGDCHGAKPYCDLKTYACESCPFECCEASDCSGRGSCDLTAHTCTCASNSDCTGAGATYCDPQTHACGACASGCCSSNDCSDPTKPYCDPTTSQCVGCTDSSQCGNGLFESEVCEPTTLKCVQCASDADCSANTVESFLGQIHCNAQNSCVACVDDGQCATGHCSAGGVCVCLADGDCGGRTCHTDSGLCDQCADDTSCTTATEPHCGVSQQGNKTCGQCATSAQCTSNIRCLDQTCTNKECFTNDDCGNIDYCDANGQCQDP